MTAEREIREWATASLVPLEHLPGRDSWPNLAAIGAMIGDAQVVALGEAAHFISEPLAFRNCLLEYLVEEKGFTAIAIESGIVESRIVHDYVRGSAGELAVVAARGISWTFDRLLQNHALISWLRAYNANPSHERGVNFYGFDVPGSPANPAANRGVDTALREALLYLESVDPGAAAMLRARCGALLERLRFTHATATDGYERFTRSERDLLTSCIADLVALFEARETEFAAASTDADYEWAARAAIGARQVDNWLRQVPDDYQVIDDQQRFVRVAADIRDRAQADNIGWVVEQEGPNGRILVFAHDNHLSTAPMRWTWSPFQPHGHGDEAPRVFRRQPAGTYLRRRFGKRLVVICNVVARGEMGESSTAFDVVRPGSAEEWIADIGVAHYVLDLRAAPPSVRDALSQERPLGMDLVIRRRFRITSEVDLRRAFDVLLYFERATPAPSLARQGPESR